MALVRPLVNNDEEQYECPINPMVDSIVADGFYVRDDSVGMKRDEESNLVFVDASGAKKLSELSGSSVNLDSVLVLLDGSMVYDSLGNVLTV